MKIAVSLVLGSAFIVGMSAVEPPRRPSAGERAFQKCYSCHALEPGRNDLEGPTLYAIVGRRVAAEPGFDYSPAMKRFALENPRWTPELLDRLAADPEEVVPGTSMTFTGMRDARERAALVAYLKRQAPRD